MQSNTVLFPLKHEIITAQSWTKQTEQIITKATVYKIRASESSLLEPIKTSKWEENSIK